MRTMHTRIFTATALLLACGVASAQSDCKVGADAMITPATCGSEDGAIDLTPSGEGPFSFLWSTGATTEDVDGLASGSYWVWVEDQTKCSVKLDFDLGCEEPTVCQYRTQTQGGWGAAPNGGNPGVYLHANFAQAFPNGLTIGCNRVLRLTTAQAVTDFLPSGSTPKKFVNALYLNPGSSYNNVLAGQLVAATLSVTFDAMDANFGAGGGNLGDLYLASGTFAGWTVSELLAEANNFIGNCPSSYTASQLNNALTLLNESFVDGSTNTGFLECEDKKDDKKILTSGTATDLDGLLIFPNPAARATQVTVHASADGAARLMVLDAMGRMVMDLGTLSAEKGMSRTVTVTMDQLTAGSYLLQMELAGKRTTERFTVVH